MLKVGEPALSCMYSSDYLTLWRYSGCPVEAKRAFFLPFQSFLKASSEEGNVLALHLVTGGAGFIGSHITGMLVERGEQVRVLDNLTTGKKENLKGYMDRLEFIETDITRPESRRYFEGAKYIYHQAAISSVEKSIADPAETELHNVVGSVNVLKWALEEGAERVIMAGSAAVYGDAGEDGAPLREDEEGTPLSPYAFTKYAVEYYCKNYYHSYGLETLVLKYFNVFGPRQDPHSDYSGVISIFAEKMRKGERPVVLGDGLQTRDFVYVEDVAKANLLAAEAAGKDCGKVINIASGRSVSILELVEKTNEALGTNLEPVFADPRSGDVRHSRADIGLAKKLLGFSPAVDFAEGLRRTVEWMKQN